MVFVPFDATEDELAALSVIRDGIPATMAAPLRAWITEQLKGPFMNAIGVTANLRLAHDIQSALHVDLGAGVSPIALQRLLQEIYSRGEQTIMRVTDFLLSRLSPASGSAASLAKTLEWSHCKYKADLSGKTARLSLRLPAGMEEVTQSAIESAREAGPLLYKAWQYAFGLDARPAEAMDFAVKAVERVVTPVVCPNHPKPSLGNAVAYVRDQGTWEHNLRVDGDKAPPNTTIHHMLQTLWAGQHYRHVDQNAVPPTLEQAQAHVQLAALLVGWFSSGVIRRA